MKLNILLPFDRFSLLTRLNRKEVQQRLASNIEPCSTFQLLFFGGKSTKPYAGALTGDTFEIRRIIHHRNSFLPLVKGSICAYGNKTEIAIRMRPFTAILIFMSIWLGAIGSACLELIFGAIGNPRSIVQQGISLTALMPFIMFGFGYSLMIICYRIESRKSKDFLMEILEAFEKV